MTRLVPRALLACLCLAAPASAHVERPGYWPDPAADASITPATGGAVPKARSLSSSLVRSRPDTTRVVCQRDSLSRLKRSIAYARRHGYSIRPSDRRRLTARQGRHLMNLNRRLRKLCRHREIQPAVTASGNHDRVVIMPGVYQEPTSRARPTHDPACDRYRTNGDRPNQENTALSYAYQYHCPNDQNLVAVLGRALSDRPVPVPPRSDRHGIPDLGPCLRCNLQIEGSGVNADDVVIEAGDAGRGDGGPNGAGTAKDVGLRADRADGFVLKKVKVRHAKEHGIYVLESDGYRLTHFKTLYNGLYGTLTFVADHGVHEHCEASGHGDSGLYPGSGADTGVERRPGTEFRHSQEIRFCDTHHNLSGYSGTVGNAVWVHDSRIYDNALGLSTDVITGAGHPGFPGDSMLVERNLLYSNNFNVFAPESDVKPSIPVPVGTGMLIGGGNHHQVRHNHFYDNWRRGTMLFSVPDQIVCGPGAEGNQQAGCDPEGQSTSFYNSQYDNRMGLRPDGTPDPNGTDFWWDPYPGTIGNCWWHNVPAPGATITSAPPALPDCESGTRPDRSVGTGNPAQTGELASCVVAFETRNFEADGPCPWFKTPPEPQPGAARSRSARSAAFAAPFADEVPPPARGPVDRRSDLSGVTCAQWHAADEESRDWLVSSIRRFAGGEVVGSGRVLGTGNVLTDKRAHQLYDAWCPRRYAQAFVLYKLYTYAAALSRR